jgi:hypothetical protein
MIKRRILKLTIAVIIVAGSGGGLAVLGSGTALAAPHAAAQAHMKATTQAPVHAAAQLAAYTCYGTPNAPSRYCYSHVYCGAVLHMRDGGQINLNCNEGVKVACYYIGNSTDGYWDHVTWAANHSSVTASNAGHVDDSFVNFDNHTPDVSPISLDHC